MSNKNEATREQARQILKNGILDMSIARLVQMSRYGLMGNIEVTKGRLFIKNGFNHIAYDEENDAMEFSVQETLGKYGEVSFCVHDIEDISGCEDAENPEEWLNTNIVLEDETAIKISVLY